MTFGDALTVFQQRLKDDPALKPKSKEYYEYRIQALLKRQILCCGSSIIILFSSICRSLPFRGILTARALSDNTVPDHW